MHNPDAFGWNTRSCQNQEVEASARWTALKDIQEKRCKDISGAGSEEGPIYDLPFPR